MVLINLYAISFELFRGFEIVQHRRSSSNGFTLVELLIAVAITALIVVLLGAMFGSLTSTASRANQRIDAFRDARAAIQTIERDLAGLAPLVPPTKALPSDPDPPRLAAYFALDNRWQAPGNDPYSDPANAVFNHQLFAIIAAKNHPPGIPPDIAGDLCAVGYYCRWDDDHYTLRRYFRDSYELMAPSSYFANQTPSRSAPPWNIRVNGAGNYMTADKLFQPSDVDNLTANPPTLKDEILATYVWDFHIAAYDTAGAVINPQTSNGITTTQPPYLCDPSATTATPLPVVLEISLKAMSSQAARALIAATSARLDHGVKVWMADTDPNATPADLQLFKRLIAPHSYQFRTKIHL